MHFQTEDRITIKNLKVKVSIGVTAAERSNLQEVSITLELVPRIRLKPSRYRNQKIYPARYGFCFSSPCKAELRKNLSSNLNKPLIDDVIIIR